MSGLPNTEGVARLRELAAIFRTSHKQILDAQAEIHRAQDRMAKATDANLKAHDTIIVLLKEMDCAESGNHGWDQRIAWLMGEMESQGREQGARDAVREMSNR